jgi:hypothetical protein
MITDIVSKQAFKSNHPCQDYVYAFHKDNEVIVKLSDGCSSSPDTDIGARIAVHNRYEAQALCDLLRQPYKCLDVTLLTLEVSRHHELDQVRIKFECVGDGFFAMKLKGEDPYLTKVEFIANTPYYISHSILPSYAAALHDLRDEHGNPKDNKRFCVSTYDNEVKYIDHELEIIYDSWWNISDIEWVAIFSDGITKFKNLATDQFLDPYEVMLEATNIQVWNGTFLNRRINKMLKKYHSQGIITEDDLSMGVIKI